MRSSAWVATALGCIALISGFGGPIQDDELERGVLSLGSTAAAGSLLTEGVISDRTKTTFVRVSARDLGAEATHEAEKLQDAESDPATIRRKRDAVLLARGIADALLDLQVAPTDPAVARSVQRRLDRFAARSDALARKL